MIIYGTGGSELGMKNLKDEKCPHCEEKGQVHIQGISRYFSLFWIPVFPFSKKIFTFCNACENEIPKEQYSRDLKARIDGEKSNFKFPLTNFAGLFIIGLIAAYFIYQNQEHDSFVENRIQHVQQGDLLILKENSNEFYFLRVDSNVNDEIYFKYSNYFLDQKPTRSDYADGLLKNRDFMDTTTFILGQETIDSIYLSGNLDILD